MKKNNPHKSLLFGNIVLICWFGIVMFFASEFITGAWYGENSSPQQEALKATIILVVIIVLYFALAITGNPRQKKPESKHKKHT